MWDTDTSKDPIHNELFMKENICVSNWTKPYVHALSQKYKK